MAGLEALIGRVAGTPLDRTRPLWEMHVCQPFGDDRIAVITKMHHALADGVAANALLGNIVDGLGADPRPARDRPRARRSARADPDLVRPAADRPGRRRAARSATCPVWSPGP